MGTSADVEKAIESVKADTKQIEQLHKERERFVDGLEQISDSLTQHEAHLKELHLTQDEEEKELSDYRKLKNELDQSTVQLEESIKTCKELSIPLSEEDSRRKQLWERVMGLEFRTTEDRSVSIVFRHLIPSNPDQTCTITMDVDDDSRDRRWTVVHIDPVVRGVSALLKELNETGDLTKFLKKIRTKFVDHLCGSS